MAGQRAQRSACRPPSYFLSSTTSTKCCTARIMPRTAGVSSSVRSRRILPKPRPRNVASCSFGLRAVLRIWRTVTVLPDFFSGAFFAAVFFSTITHISFGAPRISARTLQLVRGGLLAFLAFAARDDLGDAAATALCDHARALLVLERVEHRANHVVGVRGAERLRHDVANAQGFEHSAQRAAGDHAC